VSSLAAELAITDVLPHRPGPASSVGAPARRARRPSGRVRFGRVRLDHQHPVIVGASARPDLEDSRRAPIQLSALRAAGSGFMIVARTSTGRTPRYRTCAR
jgi:hypothetical protein